MTKTRREFKPEFKREAVALLESAGRPQMRIATEPGARPPCSETGAPLPVAHHSGPGLPQDLPAGTGAAPSPAAQPAEIARSRRQLDRTRMEWDISKSHWHLRGGAELRFGLIEQHARIYPVRLMCRVLGVAASGYYAWRSGPESQRAVANRRLLQEVQRLHDQHWGR